MRGKYRVNRLVARYVRRNGCIAAACVSVEVTKLPVMKDVIIHMNATAKMKPRPSACRLGALSSIIKGYAHSPFNFCASLGLNGLQPREMGLLAGGFS